MGQVKLHLSTELQEAHRTMSITTPHYTLHVQHHTTPHHITPHYTTPHTAPHHTTPHHTLHHTYNTTPHHTLHHTTPHSAPHHTTPHHTTLHHTTSHYTTQYPKVSRTVFLAQNWKRVSNLPEEVEEANPQEESAIPHKPATCYV